MRAAPGHERVRSQRGVHGALSIFRRLAALAIRQALRSAKRARNTPRQPFWRGRPHRSDWHSSVTGTRGSLPLLRLKRLRPLPRDVANSERLKEFQPKRLSYAAAYRSYATRATYLLG
jgi:hypothetical protein